MSTRTLALGFLLVLALGASGSPACGLIEQDGGPAASGSGGDAATGGASFEFPDCERVAGQNEGATSGPFVIRGRALTEGGVPIANLQVTLEPGGAVHYTSLLGTYALDVEPGTYTLEFGDGTCLVDPAGATITLADENVTVDVEGAGGACTTATPANVVTSGRGIAFDDPSLDSGSLTYDWSYLAAVHNHVSPEGAEEHLAEVVARDDAASPCTTRAGGLVGIETRYVDTFELDGAMYSSLSLTTTFLQGQYAFTFLSGVSVDATDETIAPRRVPVRNLTEADFDELLERHLQER